MSWEVFNKGLIEACELPDHPGYLCFMINHKCSMMSCPSQDDE